jgi:hypothetical protein
LNRFLFVLLISFDQAQLCAFVYLQELFDNEIEKPLLFLMDSDVTLHRFAIAHFVYEMISRPFCEALTGLITIDADGFLCTLQNCEYIDSQLLHRSTESVLGGVTCLPGAMAMIRFESLRLVASEYFSQLPAENSINFAKRSLGEDRYLTSLLLESNPMSHRIGFSVAAKCKTDGCSNFVDLLRQRRRWFLGTISNEVAMLSRLKLWQRLPGLQIFQLFLSLRNAPLFAYLVLAEMLNSNVNPAVWKVLVIITCVYIPIWLIVSYVSISMQKNLKAVLIFPVYAFLMPLFGAIFELYGIATCRQRTWGGPRMQQNPIDMQIDLSDQSEIL